MVRFILLFGLAVLGLASFASATEFNQTSNAINNAFFIKLVSDGHLEAFHQRATTLMNYTVRHEFRNSRILSGVSVQVNGNAEDALSQLKAIPGIISVSKVYTLSLPVGASVAEPLLSDPNPSAMPTITETGNVNGALEMGGVDKLHALGIKGKGVKIGVVDTGVDHRHPALGAGFGPGHKIAGGYSFVLDDGTLQDGLDPLATCYGGAHGTHVSGILGMDPVSGSFDISGVAPEASIYMYRVFDCNGNAGSDTIAAGMLKALDDGVDLISISIGIGAQSFNGAIDPLAAIVKEITSAGVAVIVANANDGSRSMYSQELYTEEWPSTEPSAIGVGAVANAKFPLVYTAEDSARSDLSYGSVYPLPLDFTSLDVYLLDNGCDSTEWTNAIASISNISETIIGFPVDSFCTATSVDIKELPVKPVYIMGYNSNTTDPYLSEYTAPSRGFYGNTTFLSLTVDTGTTLINNYASAGGYGNYKIYPKTTGTLKSVPQTAGGMMDYYSSFGPTWHDYVLKPQISAPGGSILSTWPLGPYGAYTILSGTSMATPYLAACYALVLSKFPGSSISSILSRLQTSATPLPWVYDQTILSATAQQGAGLVNAYNAIFASSEISPGQIKISDVSTTVYGAANFTIKNTSPIIKTYTFSHEGAGYMDYYLSYQEVNQQANYGTATFPTSSITLLPDESRTVPFSISPPASVRASALPVFGGFVIIKDSEGEGFSIPYIGPPYSLFNTPYLLYQTASQGTPLPSVYAYTASGSIQYDTDLLEINATLGFQGSVPTLQWSTHVRVDLVPANTSIPAQYYGFNQSFEYEYQPSVYAPNDTLFGYASFGNLVDDKGFVWPGSYPPGGKNTMVTGSDGVRWAVGPGDYRWYASVLRWGGVESEMESWDTWLGPVVRYI